MCLCACLCPSADELVVVSEARGRKRADLEFCISTPSYTSLRSCTFSSKRFSPNDKRYNFCVCVCEYVYAALLYVCSYSERSRAGHRRSKLSGTVQSPPVGSTTQTLTSNSTVAQWLKIRLHNLSLLNYILLYLHTSLQTSTQIVLWSVCFLECVCVCVRRVKVGGGELCDRKWGTLEGRGNLWEWSSFSPLSCFLFCLSTLGHLLTSSTWFLSLCVCVSVCVCVCVCVCMCVINWENTVR